MNEIDGELDWEKAKEHLDRYEAGYRELVRNPAACPWFALSVIVGLRMRFEKGERTPELYEDIMSVE